MNQAIITAPPMTWYASRILESVVTDRQKEIYRHALKCMRQAIQSPLNRLIQNQHTGGWIDFEHNFVSANEINRYAYWCYFPDTSEKLGDFIRVI
jgi:hypothetical protein